MARRAWSVLRAEATATWAATLGRIPPPTSAPRCPAADRVSAAEAGDACSAMAGAGSSRVWASHRACSLRSRST
eukprot:scaffold143_cov110-Isochrysis_galbana.AAC.7